MVFDQMRARHVDGFVLATATLHNPILAEAAEAGLPVVLMNRTAQGYPFSSVSVDNEQGERAAVDHLVSLGHTRIGHIAGPQDVSTGVARLRGFFEGMDGHGLTVDDAQVVSATGYSIEEGLRCGLELLEANRHLTAIVAANDLLAVGCYGALDELGLRCPEDMSVIGFNDMPFIDRLRPPLSTVRFPHYKLGTEAADLLLERIEDADSPVKILYLAPELVARGSTVPLAATASADDGRDDESRARREHGPAAPRGGAPQAVSPRRHLSPCIRLQAINAVMSVLIIPRGRAVRGVSLTFFSSVGPLQARLCNESDIQD